jgi:hypothetical protein
VRETSPTGPARGRAGGVWNLLVVLHGFRSLLVR